MFTAVAHQRKIQPSCNLSTWQKLFLYRYIQMHPFEKLCPCTCLCVLLSPPSLSLSHTNTHMCTCIQTCTHTCMCTSRATTRLERLLSRFWQAGYLCVMFVWSKQLFAVSLSMLKTHTALHPFCLHPADYQVFALWCVTWVAKEETSQSSCSFEFTQEDGGKDSLGSNIMRKWF